MVGPASQPLPHQEAPQSAHVEHSTAACAVGPGVVGVKFCWEIASRNAPADLEVSIRVPKHLRMIRKGMKIRHVSNANVFSYHGKSIHT